MSDAGKVLLEMKEIQKSFIGVNALKGVNLTVRQGEVHALAGENGAGKSVLIKILTGIHQKDEGRIIFDGKEVHFTAPIQAQIAGIRSIYQELNTVPHLSIAENMFLGNEIKKYGIINWKSTRKRAREILSEMGIDVDVDQPINRMSAAVQQMISIAVAVSMQANLVVMDESTSSLDDKEVKFLMEIIRKLKKNNVSVIFITHRMNEIYEICDRVTILKDGELVGEYLVKEISKLDLISKMIGREASSILDFRKPENTNLSDDDVFCRACELSDNVRLHGINFEIKRGEILGLAGLLGSGRTEVARSLFGSHGNINGELEINNQKVKLKSPIHAMKKKIAFCPEERKAEAIFPDMSIRDNMTISILSKISTLGFISRKKQDEIVKKYIEALKIKTPSDRQQIKFLSGGNQQKVILARGLSTKPDLIILDEPTRGIDVGAKLEIEQLIQEISSNGISVLMISSILEELVRNCDRIIIIKEGKKTAELMKDEISENSIIHAISQAHLDVAT